MDLTHVAYWEWERKVTWQGGRVVDTTRWMNGGKTCIPTDQVPDELRTPSKQEIREQVLQELPKPEPLAQPPNGRTLVNLDTIFRVDTEGMDPFTATVEVVGQDVAIRARPSEFSWNFGDGSDRYETDEPGRKYPHKDIVHRYESTGEYEVDVDITYTAEFRLLPGGKWTDLGAIEITDGPTMPLQVVQSRSRLSD